MSICTKCILPENFPNADLDEQGICYYCRAHMKNPRIVRVPLGDDALKERILSGRGSRAYDCIVPLSGGKDSSYILYYVVTVLGLNPLAITVDSGFLHPDARKNIQTLCDSLGVDLIMQFTKYRRLHARESLIISRETGEDFPICGGCETDIRSIIIRQARKHKIRSIVYGATDFENNYLSFIDGGQTFRELYDNKQKGKRTFREMLTGLRNNLRETYIGYTKHFLKLDISFSRKISAIWHLMRYIHYRIMDNLDVKTPEGLRALIPNVSVSFDDKELDIVYFFDYIQYNPSTQIHELLVSTGWRGSSEGKESRMDCQLHPIVAYRHLTQTNITSDGFTASVLVRYNLMDRGEALRKEQEQQKKLRQSCAAVLEDLGVSGLYE